MSNLVFCENCLDTGCLPDFLMLYYLLSQAKYKKAGPEGSGFARRTFIWHV